MFSEIFLILSLMTYVLSFTSPRQVMEDIFYGDSPLNKKSEFIKLKAQIEKSKFENIPISDVKLYHSSNLTNFRALKRLVKTNGNCSYLLSLKNSLSHSSDFTENINNLKAILNDKNYLFNDEEGNLIVYSTCTNFIDLSCIPQFIFISKL
jgi:lysyl-tRNA synthetase class I